MFLYLMYWYCWERIEVGRSWDLKGCDLIDLVVSFSFSSSLWKERGGGGGGGGGGRGGGMV